jgi:hypothetical protein
VHSNPQTTQKSSNPYNVPISSSTSIRVYSDTQPHNLKISDLQKGLILVQGETETVGEGTGFGVPVLVYSDETRFSGASRVQIVRKNDCAIIRKEFIMDRIARNRFRNVTLENRKARDLIAFLAQLYQLYPKLRFLTLKGLARNVDIGTVFVKKEPVGKVIVTYFVSQQQISVNANFKELATDGLESLFMLNEQGSRFYRRYLDSLGTELRDTKIGAWNVIDADWAALTTLHGELGFRLWKKEESILRRGREFLNDSLDWVGLDYEIRPGTNVFKYQIEILDK